MKRRWLTLAACAAMPVGFAAEPSTAEILQQLQALQQQVQAQQQVIETLRAQVPQAATTGVTQEQVNALVKHEVETAMKDQAGPGLTLGKGIDGLKLTGDLRLRYEYADLDGDSDSGRDDVRKYDRFRHRARLGGVWTNKEENWEVGIGMEYGSGSGNSANDSWNKGSVWESGDVYLDYAYAKHTFADALAGLTLTLGQQKNPFLSSFAMFDGDLRPTGLSLQYSRAAFFGTLGAYNLRSDTRVSGSSDQSTANMVAAQAGLTWSNERSNAKVALAVYAGDSETSEYTFGESNDDYSFTIAQLYAEAGTTLADAVKAKVYGEFLTNLGVDSDFSQLSYQPGANYRSSANDSAWSLGVEFGWQKFKASYAYAHIEGDSVPWFFADSDFGAGLPDGALNAEGHVLSLGYALTKNCELRGTLFLVDPLDTDRGNDGLGVTQTQLDVIYKF